MGVKNKSHNRKKRTKKGPSFCVCGRNVRKDDGPHPDDDDLSRLNKRVYYLFFKKKSGETVEEEEKKNTHATTTTARSSVFGGITPQSASTRGVVYFLDFR